ncbi:hypothetical protein Droror1_Dr00011993 [Drosera rotundifolia]
MIKIRSNVRKHSHWTPPSSATQATGQLADRAPSSSTLHVGEQQPRPSILPLGPGSHTRPGIQLGRAVAYSPGAEQPLHGSGIAEGSSSTWVGHSLSGSRAGPGRTWQGRTRLGSSHLGPCPVAEWAGHTSQDGELFPSCRAAALWSFLLNFMPNDQNVLGSRIFPIQAQGTKRSKECVWLVEFEVMGFRDLEPFGVIINGCLWLLVIEIGGVLGVLCSRLRVAVAWCATVRVSIVKASCAYEFDLLLWFEFYYTRGVACYMGREWELSFRPGMRPWIAVAYSAPVASTAVFLIYPIGQGSFSMSQGEPGSGQSQPRRATMSPDVKLSPLFTGHRHPKAPPSPQSRSPPPRRVPSVSASDLRHTSGHLRSAINLATNGSLTPLGAQTPARTTAQQQARGQRLDRGLTEARTASPTRPDGDPSSFLSQICEQLLVSQIWSFIRFIIF